MIEGRDRGLDQRINIKSEFGFGFFSHIRFRCMHSLPRVCRTWEALRYSNTTDILSLLILLLVVLQKNVFSSIQISFTQRGEALPRRVTGCTDKSTRFGTRERFT